MTIEYSHRQFGKGLIVMVENRVVVPETVLFKTARARVKRAGRKTLVAIGRK